MPPLAALVSEELGIAADPRVVAVAGAIAAQHGKASRAVLFYGSCLRESELDERMLDFYLIVSDYRAAYAKKWLAFANALIPPNVFYFEHDGLAAKYAVLSEKDFERECSLDAQSVSVVARFSQPSRLVWVANSEATESVLHSVAQAAPTLLDWALPCAGVGGLQEIWKRAYSLTFGAELRAEREGRADSIVDTDPERYQQFGLGALQAIAIRQGAGPAGEVGFLKRPDQMARWWKWMQWKGKSLSVIRLAKASLTFAGGPDYIAWKINRHAGTAIELKPWQRRFPLLAALSLLPKLLKSGAVR